MLAGNQFRQIAALLIVIAVAADLIDAKIGMRAIGQTDGSRGPADLLHGDAMGEIAKARAAIIFLDRDAVQTESAHRGPQIDRKIIGAIDFGRARRDFGRCKGAHGIAQHVQLGTEGKVEAGILHGCGPWTAFGLSDPPLAKGQPLKAYPAAKVAGNSHSAGHFLARRFAATRPAMR